jgi:nucleotide-binding universal stress UspA family protein
MRTILAVLWSEQDAPRVLDAAFTLAARFASHLTTLYVRPTAENFLPSGDFGLAFSKEYMERIQHEGHKKAVLLRGLFDAAVERHRGDPGASSLTAEWVEAEGSGALYLGGIGRVHDLIVLARPDAKSSAENEILLEAALFETGRAVLTVPPNATPQMGTTTLVAWNGSTETVRALAMGLPLLAGSNVTVLSVDGAMVPGPSSADIVRYLQHHNVPAQARHIANPSSTAGETFLSEATAIGADLIIKGAYTQSRLRQMVFGGSTRHIIANATLPVLMAH